MLAGPQTPRLPPTTRSHYTPFSLSRLFKRPSLPPPSPRHGQDLFDYSRSFAPPTNIAEDWVAIDGASSFGGGEGSATGTGTTRGEKSRYPIPSMYKRSTSPPQEPPSPLPFGMSANPFAKGPLTTGNQPQGGRGSLTVDTTGSGPSSHRKNPPSPFTSPRFHYTPTSFAGGIGESPTLSSPSTKGKERDRTPPSTSVFQFPSPTLPASTPAGRRERGFSASSAPGPPTVGKATSVRTSLLGFGMDERRESDASDQEFGLSPRKAPLPPGTTHLRRPSEGLGTVREVSGEIVVTPSTPTYGGFGFQPPPSTSSLGGSIAYRGLKTQPLRVAPKNTHTPNQSHSTHQSNSTASGSKPPLPPKSALSLLRVKQSSSVPNLKAPKPIRQAIVRSPSVLPSPTGTHYVHSLQAQTICDAFVFPKPRFVAHVISPPSSPGYEHARNPAALPLAVQEGLKRERERDEWASKASRSILARGPSFREREHQVTDGSTLVNRLRARTLSGMKRANSTTGTPHRRKESRDAASEEGRRIREKRSEGSLLADVLHTQNNSRVPAYGGVISQPGTITSISQSIQGSSGHPYASQRTHSRTPSGSGASVVSHALRKVKSLCGPEELSPAMEVASLADTRNSVLDIRAPPGGYGEESPSPGYLGESSRRASPAGGYRQESPMDGYRGESPIGGYREESPLGGYRHESPSRGHPYRESPSQYDEEEDYGRASSAGADVSHLSHGPPSLNVLHVSGAGSRPDSPSSHLDMRDDDETAEIQQVVRRVSISPGQATNQPSVPIEINSFTTVRPQPVPSPAPSSYHGVYGIAIGTPSGMHPFAQSFDEVPAVPLSAGPHLSSPTWLQIPGSMDVSARHRFPHYTGGPNPPSSFTMPSSPPTTSDPFEHDMEEEEDDPSSVRPLYARSEFSLPSRPVTSHPYAAQATPRNYRASVNSVEAMFGGELLESSHTTSPLGVREAGEMWINSTDTDPRNLTTMVMEDMHYSPTERSERRETVMSEESLFVESPPQSMFPSFRQDLSFRQDRDRASAKFDAMTFGGRDDESVREDDRESQHSYHGEENTVVPGTSPKPASISSSGTSSISPPPRLLGSSDDLESFNDLFYVPRSRQPSDSPKLIRSDVDAMSEPSDEVSQFAATSGFPQRNRIVSPLTGMRHSFETDFESESAYRASFGEMTPDERGTSYFPNRNSVYDIIEEEESVRSSVERVTADEMHMGSVSALSPQMIGGHDHRASTQPSVHDSDRFDPTAALPRRHFTSFDSPSDQYRTSYLTTTSGTSQNRMSHIIADFPVPPIQDQSGVLDYYLDPPHSFTPPTDATKPFAPFRSDSFGPV